MNKPNVASIQPKPITVTFNFDRDTKNTHRYNEVGDPVNHIVGSLYIKKSAFSGTARPDAVKVSIERA